MYLTTVSCLFAVNLLTRLLSLRSINIMFDLLLWTLVLLCLVVYLSKRVTRAKGVVLFPGCLPLIGHGLLLVRTKGKPY